MAWSLGFGEVRAQVVLGQPLNLAVPVTLGDGEALGAECASAEVTAGEVRLAAGVVRVRVAQGRDAGEAVIRVVTTVPIEEPVVQVTVGAGCPTRASRALTLLADPPMLAPIVSPVAADTPAVPTRTAEPAPAAAVATPAASPTTSPAPRRATRPAPPPRATRASSEAVAPAPAASAPMARPGAAARATARPETPSRPRLLLDAGTVSSRNAAALQLAEAQAAAASAAAAAAADAASAAERRMRDMEADLARVRADAKAQTDALLQLRQQIAQDRAARERQSAWVTYLVAAVAALLVVAGWLAWRVRQLQSTTAREAWWERSQASELSPPSRAGDSAFVPSQVQVDRASTMGALTGTMATPVVTEHGALDSVISPPTVAAPMQVTLPPAPPPQSQDESTRAMSVDEQIDLEQQADFFIALGHDDAAIDLLMAHLRSTGGGTPLPFLKLLEIHRRRGDREAYERTRVRFDQRFNSVAPDWNADPKAGRTLEDYPLTIGRLQHAWGNPLDAMAELEALLFRRGTGAELFELPAYQEVLFLYQLARDLHQAEHPASEGSAVDVLLPISDAPSSQGKVTLRPEFAGAAPAALDLDLDLGTDGGGAIVRPGDDSSLMTFALDLDATPPADEAPGAQPDQAWDDEDKDRRNR
ncbi:MAG TPA: hypothetical protein VFQ16_15650 [Burkholderiaceae bacterium]|nr:hypothetical protein [Burkholderiaceae bacterium]